MSDEVPSTAPVRLVKLRVAASMLSLCILVFFFLMGLRKAAPSPLFLLGVLGHAAAVALLWWRWALLICVVALAAEFMWATSHFHHLLLAAMIAAVWRYWGGTVATLAFLPALAWALTADALRDATAEQRWGSLLFVTVGYIVGAAIKIYVDALATNHARIDELVIERPSIPTAERARLARDLHDVVAHDLSKMCLALTTRDPHASAAENARLLQLARTSCAEAGQLLASLTKDWHSDAAASAPQKDIGPEIRDVAEGLNSAGFACTLRLDDVGTLPVVTANTLIRFFREAAVNILRYAEPGSACEMVLSLGSHSVVAEANSVVAKAPQLHPESTRTGLRGLGERVELLGGELSFGQQHHRWNVRALIPTTLAGPRKRRLHTTWSVFLIRVLISVVAVVDALATSYVGVPGPRIAQSLLADVAVGLLPWFLGPALVVAVMSLGLGIWNQVSEMGFVVVLAVVATVTISQSQRAIWITLGGTLAYILAAYLCIPSEPTAPKALGILTVIVVGISLCFRHVWKVEQRARIKRTQLEQQNAALRARERDALARELHGVVTAGLARVSLVLDNPSENHENTLSKVETISRETLSSLRGLVATLREEQPAAGRGSDAPSENVSVGAMVG